MVNTFDAVYKLDEVPEKENSNLTWLSALDNLYTKKEKK